MNTIIILASSGSKGNTRKVVDRLIDLNPKISFVDLNEYSISYFDYSFKNSDDDFIPLIKRIIDFDQIIFATPVYWYTMSAQLKTFIDRFTDLLIKDKPLGRKLKNKNLYIISCADTWQTNKAFYAPFKLFAKYLSMNYKGALSTCIKSEENNLISILTAEKIERFSLKIQQG